MRRPPIEAVVFDKDGTLFDFEATWSTWAAALMADLAKGDPERLQALAQAADFDLEQGTFRPTSIIIAGTNMQAAACLAQALPNVDVQWLERHMMEAAQNAPLAEAAPLAPLLSALSARGLALGVMTNDNEATAIAHLRTAGVLKAFDFIAGFDSGFGAKPAPDPLLAFAEAVQVAPQACVMVGDSRHDLLAGRAANMRTVGVLTGMAREEELADLSDVVLPDIGHLPRWLDHI